MIDTIMAFFSGFLDPVVLVTLIILFIVGYIMGNNIKSGLKYGALILIFIVVMVIIGFIPTDILSNIVNVISVLKPLLKMFMGEGNPMLTMSKYILAFAVGVFIGFKK